jgi:hypothetical protein
MPAVLLKCRGYALHAIGAPQRAGLGEYLYMRESTAQPVILGRVFVTV